ncbi:hypothetical protein D3C80_1579580 [compost metagenome]
MTAAALLNGFADHGRLRAVAVSHGVQQGQRGLPFVQIVTGIFTQCAAVGAVIEQIVDQLECGAEIAAIILQRFFFCFAGLGKDR